MANITVSVPTSNITVDTTNSIVNVASTSSNVVLSATAAISNADVREAISVSNVSGFGDLAYDNSSTSNGIIQYTGVSTAEIRGQVSATKAGGDGTLVYDSGTGVLTYTGPTNGDYRGAISATAPMLYNSTTGVISIDSGAVFSGKTTDDLAQGTQNIYFSQSGATVNTDALPQGSTNLYLTDTNFNNKFAGKTTNDLAEGTNNKYFTTVGAAINTNALPEGSLNKYFTTAGAAINTDALPEGTTNKYYANTLVSDYLLSNTQTSVNVTTSLSTSNVNIDHIQSRNGGNVTMGDQELYRNQSTFEPYFDFNRPSSNNEHGINLGKPSRRFKDIFSFRTFASDIVNSTSSNVISLASITGTSYSAASNTDALYRPATVEFGGFQEDTSGTWTSNWAGNNPTLRPQGYEYSASNYNYAIPMWSPGGIFAGGTLPAEIPLFNGLTDLDPVIDTSVVFAPKTDFHIGDGNHAYRDAAIEVVKTNRIFIGNANPQGGDVKLDGLGGRASALYADMDSVGSTRKPRIKLGYSNPTWGDKNEGTITTYADIVDTAGDFTIGGTVSFTAPISGNVAIAGNLQVSGNIDYVNAEDLLVKDQSISLNVGNVAQDAMIIVDRAGSGAGANTEVRWNETTDRWTFTNDGSTYNNILTTADLPADAVTSVNTFTGAVSLDTDNIPEGTAKYYATSLFNTDFATKTTTDLAEGTNLYYTDARSRAAVSVTQASASGTGALAYDNGTGVFTYTPPVVPTGDITDVVAGLGLSGGGSSGAVTLALDTTSSTFVDGVEGVLSVTTGTAVSGGSLAYDNTSGVFTFAPSTGIDLDELSVTTAAAAGGGALAYDNTSGVFTFTPTSIPVTSVNGITGTVNLTTTEITEGTRLYYTDTRSRAAVSTTTGTAVAGGALTYDNTTGVFTYAPSTAQDSTQIVNGTSTVSIPTINSDIDFTVGGAAVGSFATTGAAYPAEFTVQGNITALSNVSAQEFIGSSINSTAGFTINSGNGTTVTSKFGVNNTVTETANITGKGYGVFNVNTGTEGILTYTGATALAWYILSGSTVKDSTTLTISSILNGIDGTSASLTDLNIGQVIGKSSAFLSTLALFPSDAYVTAIQSGSGTVTMSKPAVATQTFGTITAANLVAGTQYKIVSVGDTDFTAVGASSNTINTQFGATGAGTGTGLVVDANEVDLDAGLVDTDTGLVVALQSDLRLGGGSATALNKVLYQNFPFGYPVTGPEPTDFDLFTIGTSSDYAIGDYSAYTMGQTPVTNADTALNAPLGITIGEKTQLTNRGENDIFKSFGLNMLWDGTDSTVINPIQPQVLFKSYTDNTQQQLVAGNVGAAGGAPRLFFSTADGKSTDNAFDAYPKVNQELGRLSFWGSTGTQLNPSSYNVPGFISVAAADAWDTWGGSTAGNTNVYMGATSNGLNPDTYLAYKEGELILGSGNSNPITLAPAFNGSAATPSLAYTGSPTKWADANYASGTTGAKFTVNNGGSVNAGTVGDMVLGVKRVDNSSTVANPVAILYNGKLVSAPLDGLIVAAMTGYSNTLNGKSATISASGTISASIGNETALAGNTYTLVHIFSDSYLLYAGASPVSYASIGGTSSATNPYNYVPQSLGMTATTVVSSGVTGKEWKLVLEEQSDNLKLQSGSTTIVEYTDSITDFSNRVKFKNHTSAEILALTGMTAGEVVYNSTDTLVTYFDGTNWRNIAQGAIVT